MINIWLLPKKGSNLKINLKDYCLSKKMAFRKLPVQKTSWTGPGYDPVILGLV